jgi:hypothetical protein
MGVFPVAGTMALPGGNFNCHSGDAAGVIRNPGATSEIVEQALGSGSSAQVRLRRE